MHSGMAAVRAAEAEREILAGLGQIGEALNVNLDLEIQGHRDPNMRRLRHLEATRDAVATIAATLEQRGHDDATEGQRAGSAGSHRQAVAR
jgi:hypothetical protein